MAQYEYKIMNASVALWNGEPTVIGEDGDLNDLGAQGWQIVGTLPALFDYVYKGEKRHWKKLRGDIIIFQRSV